MQPPTGDGAALVFLRLDGAPGVAGTFDRTTGLLTPTRRTWRIRPVVAERRAYVMFSGHRHGVELALERFNGWKRASVPLLELGRDHEASQSADLLRGVAAELERRAPKDVGAVVPLLRAQADYLMGGGALRTSPLTRRLGSGGALSGLATGWN